MQQLNRIENIIFAIGAILLVIGSAANIFIQSWAPWVFSVGTVMFVLMQFKQGYNGTSHTIHRLKNMITLSDILLIATALLMFANQQKDLFGISHITYVQYIHNSWVLTLLVAAILQLYATYRIDHELRKEANN